MKFWKMNGAGNDFIILDGISENITEKQGSLLARTLCERHLSVGADGLMLVLPPDIPGADFSMLFFNSDGSKGEMCGNGARCICRFGYETGLSAGMQRVSTTAGPVSGKRIDERRYRIRLNDPTVVRLDLPVSVDDKTYSVSYVELGFPGLPHAVLELPERYQKAVHRLCQGARPKEEDIKHLAELRELGRKLRHHKTFPKGANVNFYDQNEEGVLELITFERGVEDFTYACGTGTGSTVLVLAKKGLTDGKGVDVLNRGGILTVDTGEDGLYLTGPTNIVCKGEITDETLNDPAIRIVSGDPR